jgi:translation initiation factor eIF-2B subunit delta
MTKAERRELQEKQRAAKASAKASGQANKPATKQPEGGGEKTSGKPSGKQGSGGGPGTQAQTLHQRRGSRVGGDIPRLGGGPGGNIVSDFSSRSINPRGVRIFSHFGLQQKSGAGKGLIHPAVVRLGLLFSNFQITGANARCLATLITFKHVRILHLAVISLTLIAVQVIQDYTTPRNNTLTRHLMNHLSAQISHLVAARPMSVTMGNAIRQLKVEISGVDIDLPEQDVSHFHEGVLSTDGMAVG